MPYRRHDSCHIGDMTHAYSKIDRKLTFENDKKRIITKRIPQTIEVVNPTNTKIIPKSLLPINLTNRNHIIKSLLPVNLPNRNHIIKSLLPVNLMNRNDILKSLLPMNPDAWIDDSADV